MVSVTLSSLKETPSFPLPLLSSGLIDQTICAIYSHCTRPQVELSASRESTLQNLSIVQFQLAFTHAMQNTPQLSYNLLPWLQRHNTPPPPALQYSLTAPCALSVSSRPGTYRLAGKPMQQQLSSLFNKASSASCCAILPYPRNKRVHKESNLQLNIQIKVTAIGWGKVMRLDG